MIEEVYRPMLREDLHAQVAEVDGESVVVVRDPLGLQVEPMALSQSAFVLLELADGTRSLEEILDALREVAETTLSLDVLASLFTQFDQAYLLQSDTFRTAYKALLGDYFATELREPAHAGVVYPEEAETLERWLSEILSQSTHLPEDVKQETLRGLVVPHLDLRVEERAYAEAYAPLQGMAPERILLIGTGHRIHQGMFALTQKSFATPLGVLPCDVDAVRALQEAGGDLICPNDLPHRDEHALEFQLPFLQYVLATPDVPIIPLLCGSLYPYLDRDCYTDIEGLSPFLETLRGLITPGTLVVAGIDFSHIGRKFGHTVSGRQLYPNAEEHDRALIDALCSWQADAFWKEGQRTHDYFNVCGFSSMALMMAILPELRGDLRHYGVWHEEETESAVSFSAVLLHDDTES